MIRLVRVVALLVLLVTGLTATPAVAAEDSQIEAAYCKVVIAQDIRVFKSPTGTAIWGYFTRGDIFYVDRTDGSRYHTQIITNMVVDAWTTSDPRWVASC